MGIQFLSHDQKMENWMHWDDDRNRLFGALMKHDPRGLILLSGDVHRAEKLSIGNVPMEMTSSGMNNAAKTEVAKFLGASIMRLSSLSFVFFLILSFFFSFSFLLVFLFLVFSFVFFF